MFEIGRVTENERWHLMWHEKFYPTARREECERGAEEDRNKGDWNALEGIKCFPEQTT